MPPVDRFSVSLDSELLAAFDRHIAAKGYENRSEAIRDLIRDLLVTSRLQRGDEAVVATLTLVCEHHVGDVASRLRAGLSAHSNEVVGALHLPLAEAREYVVILLRGTVERVQSLANEIQAMRGVTHGHLSLVPNDGR